MEVQLMTNDAQSFLVKRNVVDMSITLKNLLEDTGDDVETHVVPLPNVSSATLSKVLEYCKYHVDAHSEDEKKAWEAEFVKLDQATIFELILASNYLDIKDLIHLLCTTVANLVRGKTPEEIRKTFNIKNDFTKEEEELAIRENAWAFA
jgi:S-phase kinase-associated protein 1